jgi:5-(carboxyamino)imidazole ribonucleotide synthase
MLAQAGASLGLEVSVLARAPSDPAVALSSRAFFGTWEDPAVLRRFFQSAPKVCFENEFAPCELLVEAARGIDVEFLPSLESVFQLQDKIRQKEICERLKIPFAPMVLLDRRAPLSDQLAQAKQRFPQGWVLKWAQLGYDGYGTFISGSGKPDSDALQFLERARKQGVPVFAEEKIAFRRELAIVAVRSVRGEWTAYPLVVSHQKGGICHHVLGPARALGIQPEIEHQAHEAARKLGEALELCGAYALEFFETADGRLLLNEIAPRVHNTGHYTQDAADTSQFENHWRGILGLPLGSTACAPAFAMWNLLGPEAAGKGEALPVPTRQTHLHWYGKKDLRPGRKLGHLNARAAQAADLPGVLRELEEVERDWHNRLHHG